MASSSPPPNFTSHRLLCTLPLELKGAIAQLAMRQDQVFRKEVENPHMQRDRQMLDAVTNDQSGKSLACLSMVNSYWRQIYVVCSLRRGLATSSIDPLPPKSTLPYSQHHFFRIKSNISRDSIHHNHSPQSHKNHPFTSMAGHNHPVLVRHFRHHRHPIPSFLSDRADLPTLPY